MAAVSLFWNTNMAAVTSCENTLLICKFDLCQWGFFLRLPILSFIRLHFKPESYIHTCIRVFKQYIDYFQRASSYEPGWLGWLGYRDEFSLAVLCGCEIKVLAAEPCFKKRGVGTRRLKYPLSRGFAAHDGSVIKSHSTILQRLRRQISLDYYTIPPATQARMNFALGSYFSPVSEMRKGQRSWGRFLAPNSGNKTNIAKHKHFSFRAYLSIGNS